MSENETDMFDRASTLRIAICGTDVAGNYDYESRIQVGVL